MNHSLFMKEKGGIPFLTAAHIDPTTWFEEHKKAIDALLLQYGGVVLRGFAIREISEFNHFAKHVHPNLLDYTFASTPRTKLEGRVYTSTEFRADKEIPFHNEKSYTLSWPTKLMFFCHTPSPIGGQTPICDSRRVYRQLDPSVVRKFEERGVLYVRRYLQELDLSWQAVFQTEDPSLVETFCQENKIAFSWRKNRQELETKQVCPATLKHPITQEKVWFNQAHIFHASIYGKEAFSTMKEEDLSRHAYYGNGETIEEEVLDLIRSVYADAEISFDWQKGDIMLLDNILMAHARKPYEGNRKIAVAMA